MPKAKKKQRRTRNEGSVYYNKKRGLYIGQITIGYNEEGKQVRKTFSGTTKTEVLMKLAPYMHKEPTFVKTEMTLNTVKELMQYWLVNYKSRMISSRTMEKYYRGARLHIYPTLAYFKVQDVTKDIINKVLGDMIDQDYTSDMVNFIKHFLCQFFDYCIEEGYIEKNPAEKIRISLKSKNSEDIDNEYKAIPEETRERFIEVISKSPFFKPFCLVGMLAGLRPGEIISLRWKDFDIENNVLRVRRGTTMETTFDDNGKVVKRVTVIGKTKTAGSVRSIPLSTTLIKVLKEWKNIRFLQEQALSISFTKGEDYIFANNEGQLRTYCGTRCMFNRLLKENGLEHSGITFYRLRHTFSNTLFEAKENPKVVQTLMGHARVSTTMIYDTANTPKYLKEAMGVFDNKYGETVEQRDIIPETISKEPMKQTTTPPKDNVEEFLRNNNITSMSDLLELLKKIG